MGLYDKDFTATNEYQNLRSFQPLGDPRIHSWRRISNGGGFYKPQISKVSFLKSLALRFVHALLSGTISRKGDSTGVIGWHDFDYLLSMSNNVPYHVRFVVATALDHRPLTPEWVLFLPAPTLRDSFDGWIFWAMSIKW